MKLTNKNNKYLNKKIFVKKSNGKNIFSIRDIGDIPKVRARKFYSHEPDTVNWISKFPKNLIFKEINSLLNFWTYTSSIK